MCYSCDIKTSYSFIAVIQRNSLLFQPTPCLSIGSGNSHTSVAYGQSLSGRLLA